MTACQEATEACLESKASLEEKSEAVAEQQDGPKEEAMVDQYGDQRLAIECC
jgi:hypothetical protein